MSQIWSMIKLEFKIKFPRADKGKRLFFRIFDIIGIILGVLLIGGLILFVFYTLMNLCIKGDLEDEFLIFFIFLMQILQLLFGLGLLTKTLYFNSDSESLLKLPVSGEKIFFSKIFFAYFYITILSSLIMLPVLIMFGVLTTQFFLFYLMIPVICIFCPLLPFILSTLFALPTMYIISFLKNKFILMLITYVSLVAVGFITYMNILGVLIKLLDTSSTLLTESVVASVKNFSHGFYPEVLLKNILVNREFLKSSAIYILGGIILVSVIVVLAKKMYLKVLLNNVESENKYVTKRIEIRKTSAVRALFEREFINIFRSVNYSFQYLAVILTTPLMVYFSNAIASQVGAEKLGNGILPGISLLVLILFISMGVSFSATSITREGDKFFHTKIIPVKYKKQIAVKVCLYLIVAIPCIFVSCFVLYFFNFLNGIGETLLYSLAISIIVLGNICYGISKDVKNPKFKYIGKEEYTSANGNVISSLGIGMIIAVIMGITAIVFSFVLSLNFMYYVLFGFAVPYTLIEVIFLFTKVEKKYQAIEV